MKRLLFVLLYASILLTACAGGTAVPTDTAVPPTDTPQPTNTPAPTDTPLPTFTPTPDAAATAAAQATTEASSVLEELDDLLGDSDIPYQDGHLAWQQTKNITIEMQGPSAENSVAVIDESLTAGDFIFKSDVTWKATGWMFCGAIFRSEANINDGKQYQFYFLRFSGLPAWFIEVWEGNTFLGSVTNEQYSSVIDIDNGATNQFVVVAQDNEFKVYFNGVDEGRYFDNSSQRSEGQFGFMAWQESGKGSCEFENSWIWSLDQ